MVHELPSNEHEEVGSIGRNDGAECAGVAHDSEPSFTFAPGDTF